MRELNNLFKEGQVPFKEHYLHSIQTKTTDNSTFG